MRTASITSGADAFIGDEMDSNEFPLAANNESVSDDYSTETDSSTDLEVETPSVEENGSSSTSKPTTSTPVVKDETPTQPSKPLCFWHIF